MASSSSSKQDNRLIVRQNLQYEFHFDARVHIPLCLYSTCDTNKKVVDTVVHFGKEWQRLSVGESDPIRLAYAILVSTLENKISFLPSSPDDEEDRDRLLDLLYDAYYIPRGCYYPVRSKLCGKPRPRKTKGRRVFSIWNFMIETSVDRVAPSFSRHVGETEVIEYDLRTRPACWTLKIAFDLGLQTSEALGYFAWGSIDGGRYLNHVPLLPLFRHLGRRPPSSDPFMQWSRRPEDDTLLDPSLSGIDIKDEKALLQSATENGSTKGGAGGVETFGARLIRASKFRSAPKGRRRRTPTVKFFTDAMLEMEEEEPVNRNFFKVGTVLDSYGTSLPLWYQPHVEELRLAVNPADLNSASGGIVLNMPVHLKPKVVAKLLHQSPSRPPQSSVRLGSSDFPGTLLVVEPVAKWYWYSVLASSGNNLQVYMYDPESVIQNPTSQTIVIVTYAFVHKANTDTSPFSFSLPGGTQASGISLFLVWFSRIIFDDLHAKTGCAKQMHRAKYLRSTIRWTLGTATRVEDLAPTLVAANNQQLSCLHVTPSLLKQSPERVVSQLCTWCVFWPPTIPTKNSSPSSSVERVSCVLTERGRALYSDTFNMLQDPLTNGSVEPHYAYKQLACITGEQGTEMLKGNVVLDEPPEDQDCPICYEPLLAGDTVQLANCNHFMCNGCARRCVERKISTCALCRTPNPYPKAYRLLLGHSCSGRVTNYRTTKFDWLVEWAEKHPSALAVIVYDGQPMKKALLSWGVASRIPVWSADVKSWRACRKLLASVTTHLKVPKRKRVAGEGGGRRKRRRVDNGTSEAQDGGGSKEEKEGGDDNENEEANTAGFLLISRRHQKTSLLFPQNPKLVVHFSPCWKKSVGCYDTAWDSPTVVLYTEDTVGEKVAVTKCRTVSSLFPIVKDGETEETINVSSRTPFRRESAACRTNL